MKKALVVVAILSMAGFALAQGTIDIYLTNSADGIGLTKPEKAFDPTGHEFDGAEWDGYDFSDWGDGYGVPYALNGYADVPTEEVTIDPTEGEFAYIWVKMTQVVKNKKMQGLHIGWIAEGSDLVTEAAYYIGNDLNGTGAGAKRWDGVYTMEDEPEFKANPMNLAAVTSAGLKNTDSAPYPAMLQGFYGNQVSGGVPPVIKADSIWLIGAVSFVEGDYMAEGFLGSLEYAFEGGYQPDGLTIHGAHIIPEPASMLLLGLAGLLIRRR